MAIAEREVTKREAAVPVQSVPVNIEKDFVPEPYQWTRDQFHQMGEAGLFKGQRVILIEGEILAMPPIGDLHCGIVTVASDVLRAVFGAGFFVREEKPFDVGLDSEPRPDVAVCAGSPRDYLDAMPTMAALIVEVADFTIVDDRHRKSSLYARAGVLDYWIVNLRKCIVEVYREPVPMSHKPFGFGYQKQEAFFGNEIVSPLVMPEAHITASALLP